MQGKLRGIGDLGFGVMLSRSAAANTVSHRLRGPCHRENFCIGRALAAHALAAKVVRAMIEAVEMNWSRAVAATNHYGRRADELPVSIDELISRSRARRDGSNRGWRNHHRRWSTDVNSEPDSRRSEHRAARQKQTRQNLRFHFLFLLLTYARYKGTRVASAK